MPSGLDIYADESYRERTGVYVIGAAFIPDKLDAPRDAARAVLPAGRNAQFQPFHWRTEGKTLRLQLLHDAIVDVAGFMVHAYFQRAVKGADQETVRRRLLSALLADASKLGYEHLTIDKRDTQGKIALDKSVVEWARKKGRIPGNFTLAFDQPSKEPLLWLADGVSGAVQAALSDNDQRYYDEIVARLLIREFR